MTEEEVRGLLRAAAGADGLETWIADQPWQTTLAGWTLPADLEGWCFRLMRIPGGLRISLTTPQGGVREAWQISAQ